MLATPGAATSAGVWPIDAPVLEKPGLPVSIFDGALAGGGGGFGGGGGGGGFGAGGGGGGGFGAGGGGGGGGGGAGFGGGGAGSGGTSSGGDGGGGGGGGGAGAFGLGFLIVSSACSVHLVAVFTGADSLTAATTAGASSPPCFRL